VAAFAGRLDAHRATGRAEVRAATWQVAVAAGLTGFGLAAVLTGGAVLVRVGRLTAGDVIAFAALVGLLYNPLVRLTQFQRMWAATRVAIDRMMGVLDEPEGPADRPAPAPLAGPRGALTVRDVRFGYRPGAPTVLDGVSLSIPAGATVAVLGPSGAGKSTLLALLARLYDPDRGSIRLAGADLSSVLATDLRRAVALVPQQAVLFEGTIRSNLLYAAPDARPGEVRRVLEAVELAGLVDGLPLGLETPVGERGVTLSGGQRQRLTLARALLADPAVLLLDDCTSALDAETEDRVWAHLQGLAPGQTRVIVSHKLSTARRADWVVVLDQGRVAEQGRPNRLLAAGGRYADLTRVAGGPRVKQGGLHDGPGCPSAQRTGLGPVACMPE
jgi:ABC-type multidrug transport system fused ATPase/permease subunit